MDALSEAILRLLRRHDQLEQRLARMEAALNLQPIVPDRPFQPARARRLRYPRARTSSHTVPAGIALGQRSKPTSGSRW